MNKSFCPRCGSSKLFADRALAGRLFCKECSMPIDLKPNNTKTFLDIKKGPNSKKIIFLFLLILTVILIIMN